MCIGMYRGADVYINTLATDVDIQNGSADSESERSDLKTKLDM